MPGEALSAKQTTVQLKIDALTEAGAWPGAGRRTPVVPASELMAAGLRREAIRPQDCTPGVGPVNGKETQ